MRHSVRQWLVLLLLLLIVAGFFHLPKLISSHESSMSGHPDSGSAAAGGVVVESSCLLSQGACRVELAPGYVAVFSVRPETIPTMVPVQWHAAFEGGQPQRVQMLLEGKSMFMGQNRVALLKTSDGNYFTEMVVPACDMDEHMIWQATFEVEGVEKDYRVLFEFQANQQVNQ